jgi:hypothetical protein
MVRVIVRKLSQPENKAPLRDNLQLQMGMELRLVDAYQLLVR